MLTVIVILIDLEKEYYICLITKNQTQEMRLHKTATALKIPLLNFDPNY